MVAGPYEGRIDGVAAVKEGKVAGFGAGHGVAHLELFVAKKIEGAFGIKRKLPAGVRGQLAGNHPVVAGAAVGADAHKYLVARAGLKLRESIGWIGFGGIIHNKSLWLVLVGIVLKRPRRYQPIEVFHNPAFYVANGKIVMPFHIVVERIKQNGFFPLAHSLHAESKKQSKNSGVTFYHGAQN